jgi:hypothetical protein
MLSGIRDFLTRPFTQGLLFLVLVFGFYYGFLFPDRLLNEVEIQGNQAILAHGEAGVRIIDITDPDELIEIGSYDTLGDAKRLELKGENIYVATGNFGLMVLDFSDPQVIKFVDSLNTPGIAEDVALDNKHAYVADGNNGLYVVNIENPENIRHPDDYSDFDPGGYMHRIVLDGKTAYLADRSGNVRIIDVSNPNSPNELGVIEAGAVVNDIDIRGEEAILSASERGIVVFNIKEPSQPEELGSYDSNGNAEALTFQGLHAYLADGPAGIKYIDLTHYDRIAEIGKYETPSNAVDVDVKDDQVYVADERAGLHAIETDYSITAKLRTPASQPSNSVDVAVSDGVAYLANESAGVRIISISSPTVPKELGLYDTPGLASTVEVSGDYILVGDTKEGLLVLSEASSTDEKIVLKKISSLKSTGETKGLAVGDNYIYLANGNGGLRVVDFEDPENPNEVGSEEKITNALSVAVLEDYAYVADGQGGLRVVNIIDPAKPALVGGLDTPGEAHNVAVTKVDNRILVYVADGVSGLRVIDATDPRNPIEVGHNEQPDFVTDVILVDNLVYVGDKSNGLWVMDITDPINPRDIGFTITQGGASALDEADQNVYVAAYDRGLRVVDVSIPSQLNEVGAYDNPKNIVNILVEDYAYLVDQNRGLQIMDVSDPGSPKEIGFYDSTSIAKGLALEGDLAYMGESKNLKIIDKSDPEKPGELGSIAMPQNVNAIDVSDDHAFVANGEGGVVIVAVKDPSQLEITGSYPTVGVALDVTVEGIYAYSAEGSGGIQAIEVSDPDEPQWVSTTDDYKDVRAVLVVGDYAYIANGDQGLGVIDVNKPAAPEVITSRDTPGTSVGLAYAENHLFVADSSAGIQIFYILDPLNPVLVGNVDVSGGSVTIDVVPQKPAENEPSYFYVYSAGTDPGLQILEVNKTAKYTAIAFYASPRTYGFILFNLAIFTLSLIFWVYISTQLVLPVAKHEERLASLIRILQYGFGQLGAGMLIREGEKVSATQPSPSNGKPHGAGQGIVMVDRSSAVVLGRIPRLYRLPFLLVVRMLSIIKPSLVEPDGSPDLRVVGPGVHFTRNNLRIAEKVREIADLRPQIRRRLDVHGFTRDGIEVSADVSTIFSIGDLPEVLQVTYILGQPPENLRVIHHENGVIKFADELDPIDKEEIHHYVRRTQTSPPPSPPKSSPYDYNQQRVFPALFSQAHDVNDDDHMDWPELPAHVAVEVFRDILMDQVYDNLYMPSKPEEFELTTFKTNYIRRMKNLGILSYQVVLHKRMRYLEEGEDWDQLVANDELELYPIQELQNPKVLRKRGIKIIHAGFSGLRPVSEIVQEKRYDYWSAQWEREAIEIEARYDFEATRIRNHARANAQREMVTQFSEIFNTDKLSSEAMALRVFQALEAAAADPSTKALLPDETIEVLQELGKWLMP